MSEDNKALKALLDGISLMIDEKLKLAGFDRSVIGFITGANLENNTYTVQINGYEYVNVKSVIGNLGTMTPCICTIPQNQMSQMYISGIVDNTNYIDGGGGGTGGDYNDLENKPSINGVTLSGNKTTSDLGISQPTKTSQLTNDSNFVVDANYVHTDNNFTNALLSKLNGIEDGAEVNLIEKITVNGVEQTVSSKTVALTVMTNAVNDLVNYYTKSETYTKTEVNGLISAIPKFAIEVVNSLPTTDISTTTIYLLRNSETTGSDLFEEYIYVNNAWELLGAQTIDLSDYVTTSDLNTALASYVTSTSLATTLLGYVTTATWNTLGAVATSNSYNDLDDKPTIPTVNNATLTIQKNGTTVQTFTANASSNVTADIIVPTVTSDLTNDSDFVEDANYVHTDNNFTTTLKNKLDGIQAGAEVNVQADWNETDSTSDAYIQNKPNIPIVNDATLTIQRNGTNVQTFTANASTNKTANILIPSGGYFGTCNNQTSNQKKTVTISSAQNFELKVGTCIYVKFDANNTYTATADAEVMLNVNSTGDITIRGGNTANALTGTNTTMFGRINYINQYIYDGTYWVWCGSSADNNTTYTPQSLGFGYGTCSTAQATVAKTASLSGYSLITNGMVAIKFTNAVPANATLNINSKGAKAIYYRGSAITANIIQAGDIALFVYNGSQYHLITIDRLIQQLIWG